MLRRRFESLLFLFVLLVLDGPIGSHGAVSKGDRQLGIDITLSSNNDYQYAFNFAKSAGAQFVQLSFAWDEIESVPGVLQNNMLGIANSYYPSLNTKVALNLNVIDTTVDRLPSDLKGRRFNDPELVARFQNVLGYVFSQIPNLGLISISIGNEIDVYLDAHPTAWPDYIDFFSQVKASVAALRAGVPIGAKTTFDALVRNQANLQALNSASDALLVTYYPISSTFMVKDPTVISTDFAKIVSLSSKPIYFLETGYPSGTLNGSSQTKQASFVKAIFAAWDKYPSQIKALNFLWLHDLTDSAVHNYTLYYGDSTGAFGSYLQTMGLRTYSGTAKSAFTTFNNEAKLRGW
jgi:hypothetical protein